MNLLFCVLIFQILQKVLSRDLKFLIKPFFVRHTFKTVFFLQCLRYFILAPLNSKMKVRDLLSAMTSSNTDAYVVSDDSGKILGSVTKVQVM